MSVQQSEKLDQIMSKGSDPLGEFTARGVLATLQDIELKVANISARQHHQIARHRTSLQQVGCFHEHDLHAGFLQLFWQI